jgi:hypothetical protein
MLANPAGTPDVETVFTIKAPFGPGEDTRRKVAKAKVAMSCQVIVILFSMQDGKVCGALGSQPLALKNLTVPVGMTVPLQIPQPFDSATGFL